MKVTSIKIELDNGEIKEYKPIDGIILAICEAEEDGNNPVISLMSENPSLQLSMIKNVLNYRPNEKIVEDSQNEKADENINEDSPIEVVDINE